MGQDREGAGLAVVALGGRGARDGGPDQARRLSLMTTSGEPSALAFPTLSGTFCLHKIFVDRSCRGGGVGTQLMEQILAAIDEQAVDCFLTVDPQNEAAIRLYESFGFTERVNVNGYNRESEDRFVLTRLKQKG